MNHNLGVRLEQGQFIEIRKEITDMIKWWKNVKCIFF